jgi:hypothetical protein
MWLGIISIYSHETKMRAEKIKEYERAKMAEKMAAEQARLDAVKDKHRRLKEETQRVRAQAGIGKEKLSDTFGRIDLTKVAMDPASVHTYIHTYIYYHTTTHHDHQSLIIQCMYV